MGKLAKLPIFFSAHHLFILLLVSVSSLLRDLLLPFLSQRVHSGDALEQVTNV